MREFLKGLELDKETIDTIMAEHGKLLTESKETITKLNTEITNLKTKFTTDFAAIEEKYKAFDGVDLTKLNADLTAALENNTKIQGEFDGYKLTAEKDALLRERLAGLKFSSNYARNGIYAEVKDKVQYEDGKLTGFDEAINELLESQPAAFAADTLAPKGTGAQHKEGGNTEKYTLEQVKMMTTDEINKNWTSVQETLAKANN